MAPGHAAAREGNKEAPPLPNIRNSPAGNKIPPLPPWLRTLCFTETSIKRWLSVRREIFMVPSMLLPAAH